MKELAAELRKYKQVFVVCDRNVEGFAQKIAGQAGNDGKSKRAGNDERAGKGKKHPMLPITAD